jgi:molecular chaperone HtpG
MCNTDRSQFEKFWPEIHQLIKYGMLRDREFFDRMVDSIIFQDATLDAEKKFYTIQEYLTQFGEKTEKKIVYCSDSQAQSAYLHMFKEAGIPVVLCDAMIDSHFLPYLEMFKGSEYKFVRLDGDVTHMIADKKDAPKIIDPNDQRDEDEKILDVFRKFIRNPKAKIRIEALKSESTPAILSFDEKMRRMKEFAQMGGSQEPMRLTDDDHTLIVNSKNSAIKRLVQLSRGIQRDEDMQLIVNQVYDLAYLQQARFDAAGMTEFLSRSSALLGKIT